ncbi:CGNR zinc finger domain-containing protein [Nocardioides sp. C4-1]|uniref:CGNR zinc finger domain-containing protein n=1 Tax=Nocardioides sp. C4-1 TaxID=3151851 RepID=UPI00326771C8
MAVNLATDWPATAAALERRLDDAGLVVMGRVTSHDHESVRAFLDDWVDVVDETDPAARAARVNALLAASSSHPRITDHAGSGWHLHYRADDLTMGQVVAALVSVGTALHLTGRGMHRLGRCAVDGCDRVYADFSRTGRQRYCGRACANRDAVRRHRARATA